MPHKSNATHFSIKKFHLGRFSFCLWCGSVWWSVKPSNKKESKVRKSNISTKKIKEKEFIFTDTKKLQTK